MCLSTGVHSVDNKWRNEENIREGHLYLNSFRGHGISSDLQWWKDSTSKENHGTKAEMVQSPAHQDLILKKIIHCTLSLATADDTLLHNYPKVENYSFDYLKSTFTSYLSGFLF